MTTKSLQQAYLEHKGKVSDKWAIYLREYDRLFSPFRENAVRLLEIGVQNGGSLEIWSQYFPHATRLLGCDINKKCGDLTYDDPRISIIVGDATSNETHTTIKNHEQNFDIVIEDGSHVSKDIIKAFALYFPLVVDGGMFIAEDLHCSYWQEFGGGLYHPLSAIAFFKALADIVNHEHWGAPKKRQEVLQSFFEAFDCNLSEEDLAHIHSVEFINSLCIIRKAIPAENIAGARQIVGLVEAVVAGHHPLHQQIFTAPKQNTSQWLSPPSISQTHEHMAKLEQVITEREQSIIEREQTITEKKQIIAERE